LVSNTAILLVKTCVFYCSDILFVADLYSAVVGVKKSV